MKWTRSLGRMSGASCSACARSSRPPQTSTSSGRGSAARAALDDPARPLGRLAHAGVRRHFDLALLRDRAERRRRRIAIRVTAQVRVVPLVTVDHLEDVAGAPRPVRRRDQAFQVEHVGVEQQVDHRLLIVGIRSADVGRDQDAMAHAVERTLAARSLREAEAGRQHSTTTATVTARRISGILRRFPISSACAGRTRRDRAASSRSASAPLRSPCCGWRAWRRRRRRRGPTVA